MYVVSRDENNNKMARYIVDNVETYYPNSWKMKTTCVNKSSNGVV